MSDNALTITQSGDNFLSPAATIAQLRERYLVFNQFVKDVLHEGVDFQVIPGTGSKPSLVKPGAEKLAALFGLAARFTVAEHAEDWTGDAHNGEAFFYYLYRCELYRGERFVASCDGSCNSREKKYRYRSADVTCPACGKTTIIKGKEEYGGGWICFAKKGGCGAKYKDNDPKITDQPRGLIPNPDIADQVNTLQKMAQKRAFVGAVLIATNASEYFTQDIEEMPGFVDVIQAEYREEPPAKTKPAPVPAVVQAAPKPDFDPDPTEEAAQAVAKWAKTAEGMVNAAKALGGVITMTREEAEATLNSKNQRYGDIDTATLEGMVHGINVGIKKPGADVETYTRKLKAIGIILAARENDDEYTRQAENE